MDWYRRCSSWRRLAGSLSVVRIASRGRVALALAGAVSLLTGALLGLAPAASAAGSTYAVTEVPIGRFVYSVAADATTNTVYAAVNGELTVINGASHTITTQISLPTSPTYPPPVAVDEAADTVYAIEGGTAASADVINGVTDTLVATISLPSGLKSLSAAANPVTHMVYVADNEHGTVVVINGNTDTVAATISLADPVLEPSPYPFGVAVDSATNTVYVSDDRDDQIAVIDGATNTLTGRIALPANSQPAGVAVDPSAGLVYTSDFGTGAISVMDTATDSVSTLASGMTSPVGLALDAASGTLYATAQPSSSNQLGTTYVIDTTNGAITAQIPRGGAFVAVSASGGSAFVAADAGLLTADLTVITPSTMSTMSPVIAGNTSFTFTVGQPGQAQLTASATPAATFSATGLPAGLTLSPAGLLSGTPTIATGCVCGAQVTVANGVAPSFTHGIVITIDVAPAITSADHVTFVGGVASSFSVMATGFAAPTFSESGALPSGVSFTLSGELTGTPGAGTVGSYPIQITATNSAGSATQAFMLTVVAGSSYFPLGPVRVLDTRYGTGGFTRPVAPGGLLRLQVDGVDGVPASGVSAVVLNVTVTDTTAAGYLAVCPDGQPCNAASSSNLNWTAGETIPNLVVVPVGADGKVDFFNAAGNTDIVADLQGYYSTAAGGSLYFPAGPVRILDTRDRSGEFGAPLGPGGLLRLPVDGVAGIPSSGVSAVVLNVTVTNTTGGGYLAVCPDGQPCNAASSSNLNWTAGETIPNLVVVPVGADGEVDFFNAAGNTDLVIDLEGYYSMAAGGSLYFPAGPVRVLDTRYGTGGFTAPVGPGGLISLQVDGVAGVPASGVSAVMLNVTVTDTTASGYLAVCPDVQPCTASSSSNLNWYAGETIPNLVVVPVGADGKVDFFNAAGNTDMVADQEGYFISS